MCLLNVSLYAVEIHATGAEIHTGAMSRGVELVCSLAGPTASLAAAWAGKHFFPEMALAALAQGLFNLLPVYPLDGGRALKCVMPESMCRAVEVLTLILLWGFGIWACVNRGMGGIPVLPAIAVTIRRIPGKFPCKESRFAVQ